MEWLSQCIEKILQSQLLQFVATHFQWVDWVTLFFGFVGFFYGISKGLLRVLVLILESLLIAFVTFNFYRVTSHWLQMFFPFIPVKLLPVFSFGFTALPLGIVTVLIDQRSSQWFHTTFPKPLKVLGGAVAGLFYGLFMWSFFSQLLLLAPAPRLAKIYDKGNSISGALIERLAPAIFKKAKP